jgi:hypothetical protein
MVFVGACWADEKKQSLDEHVFSCAQMPKDCYKKGFIVVKKIAMNEFDKIEA